MWCSVTYIQILSTCDFNFIFILNEYEIIIQILSTCDFNFIFILNEYEGLK
jgi:hypothetical protein